MDWAATDMASQASAFLCWIEVHMKTLCYIPASGFALETKMTS